MLMRFAKVAPDGTYQPPPAANAKASYATMVYVRATIVEDAGSILSRAVTIAVRYNAVRRQMSPPGPGKPELQVLDYQNSAYTLLPLVAAAYALHFMVRCALCCQFHHIQQHHWTLQGTSMMKMYRQFEKDRDAGNFSSLPELHALSSGLKAVCTWITADGIEACRRCCGGHGYSLLSGLPTLFASYVQNVTWEGDNNVMSLQVYAVEPVVKRGGDLQVLMLVLCCACWGTSLCEAPLRQSTHQLTHQLTLSFHADRSLPGQGGAGLSRQWQSSHWQCHVLGNEIDPAPEHHNERG